VIQGGHASDDSGDGNFRLGVLAAQPFDRDDAVAVLNDDWDHFIRLGVLAARNQACTIYRGTPRGTNPAGYPWDNVHVLLHVVRLSGDRCEMLGVILYWLEVLAARLNARTILTRGFPGYLKVPWGDYVLCICTCGTVHHVRLPDIRT
jgi:hypothetical protein